MYIVSYRIGSRRAISLRVCDSRVPLPGSVILQQLQCKWCQEVLFGHKARQWVAKNETRNGRIWYKDVFSLHDANGDKTTQWYAQRRAITINSSHPQLNTIIHRLQVLSSLCRSFQSWNIFMSACCLSSRSTNPVRRKIRC